MEGFKQCIIAIDCFSKWVEVYPITNKRAQKPLTGCNKNLFLVLESLDGSGWIKEISFKGN